MPVINARTRGKQFLRLVMRVEHENHETLHAYAHFIDEPPDYVVNELIDTVLAKDPDYRAWRTEHPDSYVPSRPARQGRRRRRADARTRNRASMVSVGDTDVAPSSDHDARQM